MNESLVGVFRTSKKKRQTNDTNKEETTGFISNHLSSVDSAYASLEDGRVEAMEIAKQEFTGNAATDWFFEMLDSWKKGEKTQE